MTDAWKLEGGDKTKWVSDRNNQTPDRFKQHLLNTRSKDAVADQKLQCNLCVAGEPCEWEGGQGVRLRIFARKLRLKYRLENWQIRYNLYRLYQKGKKFAVGPRRPLPFCVEVEIKRAYQGKASHGYTFYKKGKKGTEEKEKTKDDINWLDGWSDNMLEHAHHVYVDGWSPNK
jgi:hypothetical protein